MLSINPKVKKTFKILLEVFIYLFLALCVFIVILTVTAKKSQDGAMQFFGKQVRIVVSDSMAECERTDVSEYEIKSIPVKSMVFIELAPEKQDKKEQWYSNLKVGDVVIFSYVYGSPVTLTHRIINKIEKDGGYIFVLKGDNQSENSLEQIIDTSIVDSENYIFGKVTGQSYNLGALALGLKSPVVIICIVIVPCLVITSFEIMRVVTVIKSDKKQDKEE